MNPNDISNEMQGYLSPLIERIIVFIPKVITAVLVFIVALYLATLVAKVVRKAAEARNIDLELVILFSRVTKWTVIILGATWALEIVDKNITAFIAGLGIVGFTIGFALQDIAKNFVAGILLLLQQPFDVGDAIEVVGYGGTVKEVSLRATEIKTFEGLNVTIPNADVYTNPLTNFSRAERRRIALTVGIAYGSDLEKVTQTALEAIKELPGIILEDPEPAIVFSTFGASSIDFTLYYWADLSETSFWKATDQGIKLLKTAFEKNNIEIPFPIRTMQFQGNAPV